MRTSKFVIFARRKSANPKKTERVALLDAKVQQNVGISLAKLRMDHDTIREAVLSLDDTRLGMSQLEVRC